MEEAPENGKESPHSAHANGMNECLLGCDTVSSDRSFTLIRGTFCHRLEDKRKLFCNFDKFLQYYTALPFRKQCPLLTCLLILV